MLNARSFMGSLIVIVSMMGAARAEKPEKIPVAIGSWKGPSANTFKGALRRGLSKEYTVVGRAKARVVVDGEVAEENKHFTVKVIVKAAKSGEVVEQREFSYSKPSVTQAQSERMGRQVAEIARRAPTE